jgi:VCBS repeat-containing protein
VSMTVTCVDDAPVAVDDAATVAEDAGATAVAVLTNDTDVDAGPKSISSVTQPSNGTVVITGGGTGLTYAPNANYCNSVTGTPDTFTYTLSPGSTTATVSMTVTCVDDPPVAVDDAATVTEDDAAAAVPVLTNDTDVDGGPTGIASVTQPTHGTVVVTGVVAGVGTGLTYAPNANYCNSVTGTPDTFTYTLSPGTSTATVSMTVTCVNDAPTAVNDTGTTNEDTVLTVAAPGVLANDSDPDQGDTKTVVALNGAAPLTGTSTKGAVVVINPNGSYSYDPGAIFQGLQTGESDTDSFTYTMSDTAGSASTATVNVSITGVSDAPVPGVESFGTVGNTALFVSTTRPAGDAGKVLSGSVLDNATDADSPHADLVVEPVTNAATTAGGSITILSDGTFTYVPQAGDTALTDTYSYRLCDSLPCNAGTATSALGTLSLPLTNKVWYVRNNAPAAGGGTSAAPFDALAAAQGASAAGDTVYVFGGDGTPTGYSAGIRLKPSQRLVGEARDLVIGADTLFTGTSAKRPTLSNTGADVVSLADSSTVTGVAVDPQGVGSGGICGGATCGGQATNSSTIDDVNVSDTGTPGAQPGLELDGTTGTFTISNLVVNNGDGSDASATDEGVRLNNAGTVNFLSAGAISITTNGARGLDATGTNLGTGSTFDDITVTNSGSGGVSMVNTTGTTVLGDGTGTDLSLRTTSGAPAALRLATAGTVLVDSAGVDDLLAVGGPAVDITGTTSTAPMVFDAVTSTSSAGAGINLGNLDSAFSAASGSITGAAGKSIDIDAGTGDVTYPGALKDGTGQTAEITNRTGGAIVLSGAITDTSDPGGGIVLTGNSGGSTSFTNASKTIDTTLGAPANAIDMVSNSGHTVTFSGGGLSVTTAVGKAFNASGGGTVNVTGAGNKLISTSGPALTVANTTIGSSGLTFQGVSSSGAVSGIVLTNTGSSGGLTVTGNGGACTVATPACSGGSIQSSTGPGINLTSVGGGVSLTRVAVGNGQDDGIRATSVVDIDLADSIVTNNGNNHAGGLEERGLDYLNVTGTPQILRTTVSGSDDSNANIRNTVAGSTVLTVTQSTFSDSKFNAGLRLRGEGPSVMNANVTLSTFSLNADPGFSMQTDSSNTAQQTLLFDSNNVSGGSSNAVSGRPEISINADSASVVKATVSNNKVKSAAGAEIILNTLAGHTGTFDAKVTGNLINDSQPGTLDALADGGSSIWGWAHGDGVTRMEIRNNTIQNWGGRALELSLNDGNGSADYTVTGNLIDTPDVTANNFEGIYVFAGGVTGDAANVCADLANNNFDGIGQNGVSDIVIDRFNGTQLRFAGFNGIDVPGLQAHLRSANPLSPALTVETFSNGPTATLSSTCAPTVGTP